MKYKISISISIITYYFTFLTFSIGHYVLHDDISIIRQRVLELMIWPKKEAIPSVTNNALKWANTLNSSCYWPDINYRDKSIVIWNTSEHMLRITVMAQALSVNGSLVQNNTHLRSATHCALNVWLINDWQNPNWWFNEIYIPIQATSQLLMLDKNVTHLEIEKIKNISYRAAWWLHRPQDTGANLLDMIRAQLYRSLATDNITAIEQAFSRIWEDINIFPLNEDGIQNDWSYHFHGPQLLPGSYGIGWVNNVFLYMFCSDNTDYQIDKQHLFIFGEFLTKGDAWMIIRNEWDWNVVGRSIARPSNVNRVDLVSDWLRILAQSIEINETKIELMNFADRLDNQPNATLLIGNKHFYTSDYQVHRRHNWISAIKMQSIRTRGSECTNGENIKDEHGGLGVLNLYTTNDNEYDFMYPILDWQAINGITVEHDIPLKPCINSRFDVIELPFVGGVSDGQYGLTMMDTASHNLTVKRSWHFYDDAIIALATNLTLKTSTNVWTTLASRLLSTGRVTIGFFNSTIITLSDGNFSFPYVENKTSNVQWIHISQCNIGYLLQLQKQYASVEVEIGIKSGNYDTIGVYNHPITARMLTLSIDHGIGPYTLDYNYMIIPNISMESMPTFIKQYNEELIFSCISTDKIFHGTVWPTLKRASFILWDNVTTSFLCKSPSFDIRVNLSDAGAYLFSETENDFTITVSHPMRINETMNLIVNRVGYGKGCAAVLNNNEITTNVTLTLPSSPELLGSSVNVTCKKTECQ